MTSDGIRYSNIEPDQDCSAAPCPAASACGRAETSAAPARRPWRWRGSSPAAPRTPAGRSSWDPVPASAGAVADGQQLALRDRAGSRSPWPPPSIARSTRLRPGALRGRRAAQRSAPHREASSPALAAWPRPSRAGRAPASLLNSLARARAMSSMVAAAATIGAGTRLLSASAQALRGSTRIAADRRYWVR